MGADLSPAAGCPSGAPVVVEGVCLREGGCLRENVCLAEGRVRVPRSSTVAAQAQGAAGTALHPSREAPHASRSRVASIVLLVVVLALVTNGAIAAYHALTDAFVTPIIFSPSSEAVIQSNLTLSRVVSERQALEARIEQGRSLLETDEQALRLMKINPEPAATAEPKSTRGREGHRRGNLTVLDQQRTELEALLRAQERFVAELMRNLANGLIHRVDLEREKSKLAQIRVALLENRREVLASREQLASIGADGLRSDLELLKLEADHKGRLLQQASDEEALARIDVLLAKMKARPIYRATESNQNVAFAPYTQLDGVKVGAEVFLCTLWGVFGCKAVGWVSEVLPGEVVSGGPWGAETRGQYALLDLSDPLAARARSLRVRDSGAVSAAAPMRFGSITR